MGLDAFINSYETIELDAKGNCTREDSDDYEGDDYTEIAYFRKVNWLQNWMQQAYSKKTGVADAKDFNCVHLVLTRDLLIKLREDIVMDNISPVNGFFFGAQEIYPEEKEKVLSAIKDCFDEISFGNTVTYSSWW
jgi:hypothetical protein